MNGYDALVRWAEQVLRRQIAEAQVDGAIGLDGAALNEDPQGLLPPGAHLEDPGAPE